MTQLDLVVIGASAGGLQALVTIVERLPATVSAAILIVVHTGSEGDSCLPQILGRTSRLPVAFAPHLGAIRPGHMYVAPPDVHLLVTPRGMTLNRGPRENGFRPAIDPLFRSAARVYGARVMGVILSGALDDGSYGLKTIKDAGGVTVVQDPDDAQIPGMPLSALRTVDADHVLDAGAIADVIAAHAGELVEGGRSMAKTNEPEPQDPEEVTDVGDMERQFGASSGLTCPDCGGALWEIEDGKLLRYRCHVGHQYTQDGLDAAQQDSVEGALWSAVRVLEEQADFQERLARRSETAGIRQTSASYVAKARASKAKAQSLRALLFGRAVPAMRQPGRAAKRVKSAPKIKARSRVS